MSAQRDPDLDKQKRDRQRNGDAQTRNRAIVGLLLAWETLKALTDTVVATFFGKRSLIDESSAATLPVPEASERANDRKLDPRGDVQSHERGGSTLVLTSFLIAVLAGIGFLFVYWTNAENLLLGVTLAVCFGALGVALVLYAHRLMPAKEATEPREEHHSSVEDRIAAEKEFYAEPDFHRRGLLKWIALTATGMVAAMIVSIIRSLGRPPGPSLFSTVWKRGDALRTPDNGVVTINALQPGNVMIVFPEGSIGDEKAQTVLVRVRPEDLQLPKERGSWAPMGYLAYSRVCTHAGCSVGMFEATTCQLMCPCHQSTFDVLKAAQPTGGPAARPLPQLPLYADADGTLRAGGGFTEPPGPGFWEMP